MKRTLKFPQLFLVTSLLGSFSFTALLAAPEVEGRQGQIVDLPVPPSTALPHDSDLVLGDIRLPADAIAKLDKDQIAEILRRQMREPRSTAEHIFNDRIIVPGIVFTSLTVMSFLLIYFSFRKRREMLDTVRIAIQSGQTLPASFLEALEAKSKPTADGDLRKAVLLISLGLSAIGLLASFGEEEVGRAWAIGLVPTLLGIGYLFLWHYSQKRLKSGPADANR